MMHLQNYQSYLTHSLLDECTFPDTELLAYTTVILIYSGVTIRAKNQKRGCVLKQLYYADYDLTTVTMLCKEVIAAAPYI